MRRAVEECKGKCGVNREKRETREKNADAKKYEIRFNRPQPHRR